MGLSDNPRLRGEDKAYTCEFIDERIRAVDARVDAFKKRVQKRLEDARPTDMIIVIEELAKFKANLLRC